MLRDWILARDLHRCAELTKMFKDFFELIKNKQMGVGRRANQTDSNRNSQWITLMSVIACIAVVFLHTNGCFWTFSTDRYWKTANVIESVCYFAVPCFFMITGATLLDFREKYSLKTYFSKRIKRVFIPFLVWSIIGLIYSICILKSISVSQLNVKFVIGGIINTSIISIYWFFPKLFGVYLCIPLFASIRPSLKKGILLYFAVGGLVFDGIYFMVKLWFPDVTLPISMDVVAGYLIYVIIGYLISVCQFVRWKLWVIYGAGIFGFILHMCGTYFASMGVGEIVETYKGYTNIPCILYSISIFTFIKQNGGVLMKWTIVRKIVGFISPYTLGIYLLQWFIFTSMVHFLPIETTSIWYRIGAPFIIIPVCCGITCLLRKVPIIGNIVP